jgi:hypothetical protein
VELVVPQILVVNLAVLVVRLGLMEQHKTRLFVLPMALVQQLILVLGLAVPRQARLETLFFEEVRAGRSVRLLVAAGLGHQDPEVLAGLAVLVVRLTVA